MACATQQKPPKGQPDDQFRLSLRPRILWVGDALSVTVFFGDDNRECYGVAVGWGDGSKSLRHSSCNGEKQSSLFMKYRYLRPNEYDVVVVIFDRDMKCVRRYSQMVKVLSRN